MTNRTLGPMDLLPREFTLQKRIGLFYFSIAMLEESVHTGTEYFTYLFCANCLPQDTNKSPGSGQENISHSTSAYV